MNGKNAILYCQTYSDCFVTVWTKTAVLLQHKLGVVSGVFHLFQFGYSEGYFSTFHKIEICVAGEQ